LESVLESLLKIVLESVPASFYTSAHGGILRVIVYGESVSALVIDYTQREGETCLRVDLSNEFTICHRVSWWAQTAGLGLGEQS
jgi:hypothetical protein